MGSQGEQLEIVLLKSADLPDYTCTTSILGSQTGSDAK